MNQALSDESARWPSLGFSNPLEIGRPAAAKLGQTSEGQNTWSIGYTPQRVVAVWVGSRRLQPDPQAGGSSTEPNATLDPRLAASLWHALIQYASQNLPVAGWDAPPGITQIQVCDPSGLLPVPACPNQVNEVFLSDNVPTESDNLYRTFEINRETGRQATVFTPVDKVEEKTYLVVPSEAYTWAQATGLPVPPSLYDAIQSPPTLVDTHITSPALFSTVRGQVAIRGTASGSDFTSFQIQVGQGINPQTWVQVGDQTLIPVDENALGIWNTQNQADGLYAVRLLVVHKDQHIETAVIQVTLDNTQPAVSAVFPIQGQTIRYTPDFSLVLKAQASDAVGLDHVEWWVDDQKIGSLSQAPFNLAWQGQPGRHHLVIKAFDRAGNQAITAPVNFDISN
jgi:membrane carboxypeptidase/penicillin-binding protein PbpC